VIRTLQELLQPAAVGAADRPEALSVGAR